jgi:2-polyprenyl-3-methyl-5-hydroxy-6-metoxy-1,4-benzoquinol methylase
LKCRFCLSEAAQLTVTDLHLSNEVIKPLVECTACGSFYFSPLPTASEIATCYVGDYRHDYFRRQSISRKRGAQFAKRYARAKSGRFLDVGCSIGSMMEGFREASGWEVAGTEFDRDSVAYCKSKGLNVDQGFLYECTSAPGSFDLILANNVLEHEPDPEKFLVCALGLLKQGGTLLLNIPNGRTDAFPSIRLRQMGHSPVTTNNAGHVNFFSKEGIVSLLHRTGFALVQMQSFHIKMALKKRFLLPGSTRKNRRTCIDSLSKVPPAHTTFSDLGEQAQQAEAVNGLSKLLSLFPRVLPLMLPAHPAIKMRPWDTKIPKSDKSSLSDKL